MYKNVYCVTPTLGFEDELPAYGYTPWTCRNIHELPVIDGRPAIDIIAFCGGADISPELYGQKRIVGTYTNESRDQKEVSLWKMYRDKPKFGICRGAQLLCALNGGSLYQHVNHHYGVHDIETVEGTRVVVSSVHHQQMRPTDKMKVLAWTERSTERWDDKGKSEGGIDPEVIYIPDDNALCFQGHPEFGPKSCTDYFFKLVEEYIK